MLSEPNYWLDSASAHRKPTPSAPYPLSSKLWGYFLTIVMVENHTERELQPLQTQILILYYYR